MDFCYKTANIWQIIGYVFLILKIIITLILIILGIIDVGKAVISSDEKNYKILKTILNNTKRNEQEILSLENNITAPLLRMETPNDPSQVMTYLQELTFKNLNNSDKKVDDALLQYEIITKNKIITLIKNLIDNDKLKNYTLDDYKLVYRTSDKTHIFDFNNNSYKISQNTEPIKKKHHQLN